MTKKRLCRFCGSADVPPNRAARGDHCCRACSTRKSRERREARGLGKPRIVDLPGEVWALLDGYAQPYEVSNLGRVKNALGREMKQKRPGKFPYPTVSLIRANGKRATMAIHRLVGGAFLGPRPPGHVTRHLNGDVMDNRVWTNLVWGTPKENCDDTNRHGRLPRGEKHCCAILSERVVVRARSRSARGETTASMAREYGVSQRSMRDAIAGKTWKHIGREA